MSSAIERINFYVKEAAPETLNQRSAYLYSVFIPWLRRGFEKTSLWIKETPDDEEMQQLHSAYKSGVEFFNAWEIQRVAVKGNAGEGQ